MQSTIEALEAEIKQLRERLRAPRPDPAMERLLQEHRELLQRHRLLERAYKPLKVEHDRVEEVKAAIMDARPPSWAVRVAPGPGKVAPIPSVFATDWHVGETVRPALVYGLNSYDRKVTERRVRLFAERTLDYLFNHQVNTNYPGLVMPVGGDMVSGGIHEELIATNWCEYTDAVKFCTEYLIWTIDAFLEHFPMIYLPCVAGNHGRLTKMMQYKRRAGTSMDTMIYNGLELKYRGDPRVRFDVAAGVSVRYAIYGHRYLLLHGDSYSTGAKGGDGFIGSIGPIVRGATKILGRNAQVDLGADTVLMGHWHRSVFEPEIVVGDTMKGFDELAVGLGYRYAPPSQALWLTHPNWGPTHYARIFLDEKRRSRKRSPWLSFERPAR